QIDASIGASLAASDKTRWARAVDRLRELNDGLGRIRGLVLKLRTFSRLDEGELGSVGIRESVESVLTILGHRLREEIRVVTELGQPDEVVCYAGLLNQAIMNLVSNAIDAIKGPGVIEIRSGAEGDSYVVSVADDGSGIPEAIRDRVLEPFFTTKPIGEGTG